MIGSKWCRYFSPELHYVCKGFDENRVFNKKYFKRTLYATKKDLNDNNNMDNKDKDENNSECTVFEEHEDKEINGIVDKLLHGGSVIPLSNASL